MKIPEKTYKFTEIGIFYNSFVNNNLAMLKKIINKERDRKRLIDLKSNESTIQKSTKVAPKRPLPPPKKK